jgi:predicted ester cyclase
VGILYLGFNINPTGFIVEIDVNGYGIKYGQNSFSTKLNEIGSTLIEYSKFTKLGAI